MWKFDNALSVDVGFERVEGVEGVKRVRTR